MKKLMCAGLAALGVVTAFAADPKPDTPADEMAKRPARPAFTAASRAAVKVESKREEKVQVKAARHAIDVQPQGGSGPVSPAPKD